MMKATDLRFLATLNAAETVDELERLFQDVDRKSTRLNSSH